MPVYTVRVDGHTLKIKADNEAQALAAANSWKPPAAKPVGPVFQPGKDFMEPLSRAARAMKDNPGNPLAVPGLAMGFMEGVSNQLTAPMSRALVKAGVPIYERPAAPWDPNFGKAPRRLDGAEAASEMKGVIDAALMGVRPGKGGVKPLPPKVEKPAASDVRAARVLDKARQRDLAAGAPMEAAPGALPIHQGENMASVADVLANSPGAGRRIIRQGIDDYEGAATQRTKADIARDLGGRGDYFETLDGMVAARKQAADQGMAAMADAPVALDDNAVMALRSELATSAIRERARNALASPDPEVRAQGAALNRLAGELLDNPAGVRLTLRDAQDISRTLQQQATAAYRANDGGRGEALATLGKAIRSNAADPQRGGVEGYADWLKQFGDDISREEALQLGRDIFKPSSNAEQLRAATGGMSEAERMLFQKGVGEALLDQVRSTKGDAGTLRNLLKSEENMDRVALAFPDDVTFADFMETAARRVAERDINSRIKGGSPTDPRQAARADIEQTGVAGRLAEAAGDVVTGRPVAGAAKVVKEALGAMPFMERRAFKKTVLNDPEALASAARATIDPDEMTRLLNTLNAARARDARLRAIAGRAAPLLLDAGAASAEGQRAAK